MLTQTEAPGLARAARRDRHYAAAAAAIADELRAHGATELQVAAARVVVYSCGRDTFQVSTATLCARLRDWFCVSGKYGGLVSHGLVSGVLEWMRAHGWLSWVGAYVHRWHRDLPPDDPRRYGLRPRTTADGSKRHEARRLQLCGRLRELLAGSRSSSDRRLLPSESGASLCKGLISSITAASGAAPQLLGGSCRAPADVPASTGGLLAQLLALPAYADETR